MKKIITTGEYAFTCIFEPQPEGGYTVTCPALPGLVTEGNTLEEAEWMAQDAMSLYIESLQADGEPVPANSKVNHLKRKQAHSQFEPV